MNRAKKQYPTLTFFFLILGFFLAACIGVTNVYAATKPNVKINGDDRATSEREVELVITPTNRAEYMRIANTRDELSRARWQAVRERWKGWYLTEGTGRKTVYIQFKDYDGTTSSIYSDQITLSTAQEGYVTINDDDVFTDRRQVTLQIGVPVNARRMRVSDDVDLAQASWQGVSKQRSLTLKSGSGKRTVYLQFEYTDRRISNIFQDSIELVPPITTASTFSINGGARDTVLTRVTLSLQYSEHVESVRVSNTSTFIGSEWQTATPRVPWTLTNGFGKKTVYVEFRDKNNTSRVVKKNIVLREEKPAVSSSKETVRDRSESIHAGMIIKGKGNTVYYVGQENILHPFPSQAIFYSWYSTFDDLVIVSDAVLKRYSVGTSMCVRPGTRLVQFFPETTVYAVEPGCRVRPLRSDVELHVLYGKDWQRQVLSLSDVDRSLYLKVPAFDSTSTLTTVDVDQDGVSADIEKTFHSSDQSMDTDADRLSDYEEIFYWFADPAASDTDGDGMNDGDEIMAGRSPTNEERITSVPSRTYRYPAGTLLVRGGRYYYVLPNGTISYVGLSTRDARFKTNGFQDRFVTHAGLVIPFSSRGNISSNDPLLFGPTRYTPEGTIEPL